MVDIQDILNAQNLTLGDTTMSVTNLVAPSRWSQTASISRTVQGLTEAYPLITETTSSWTNINYQTFRMNWRPTSNPTLYTYKHSGEVYAEMLGWVSRRKLSVLDCF